MNRILDDFVNADGVTSATLCCFVVTPNNLW